MSCRTADILMVLSFSLVSQAVIAISPCSPVSWTCTLTPVDWSDCPKLAQETSCHPSWLERGEVVLTSMVKTQAKQVFLADFPPPCCFSLFFSSVLVLFCFVSFSFGMPLVTTITRKRIVSNLRTVFLSYTICIFQVAQNKFTKFILSFRYLYFRE